MSDKHWTDDELLKHLFGVGPQGGHLDRCPVCSSRWELLKKRHETRRPILSAVTDEHLENQRHAVLARLSAKPRRFRRVWVGSLAAAAILLGIGFFLFRQPAPYLTESDDRIFEEIYQMSRSLEAESMAPIQSLFEEQP